MEQRTYRKIDIVCAALRLLSENECHGHGLWVKKLKLPVNAVFDTFSGYEAKSGAEIPHGEGCTIKYGGVNIILYSPSWNVGRVNYTLAHEIGHLLLGHTGEKMDEAQANLFASALLMPPCVMRMLKKSGRVRCPRDAARFFGTSVSAAAVAYENDAFVTPYDERVTEIYRKRIRAFCVSSAASLDIFDDI